jgi:hypothetical protein
MADNGTITIEGLSEFDEKLAKLKTDNPGFERRLRAVIRKILGHARANLRKDAASGLQMDSDPRHAYKAVRFAECKRLSAVRCTSCSLARQEARRVISLRAR